MDPPYPMKPGQAIRLSVTYESTTDHFGVMGFMYVTMSAWDPTCPGNPIGLSYTPEVLNVCALYLYIIDVRLSYRRICQKSVHCSHVSFLLLHLSMLVYANEGHRHKKPDLVIMLR